MKKLSLLRIPESPSACFWWVKPLKFQSARTSQSFGPPPGVEVIANSSLMAS